MEKKIYESNYEGKQQYVAECLEPAIIGMDSSWESIQYSQAYEGREGLEVVLCTNKNPSKTIAVNVTCDSVVSLFFDVVKTIKNTAYGGKL